MIEKIKGISIKGRCFSAETPLAFFPDSNDRIAIVYGRNGSGKSTVSDAFSCVSSDNFPDDLSANLFDQANTSISLSDGGKIFVFNERYIDENVKIDADGLGTIILLGGQLDLQTEIDQYTERKRTVKTDCESAQTYLDQFSHANDPISPDYHFTRIKKALQSGWAVNDAAIKGSKINSKVTEAVIKEICELSVSETASQLQQQFEETKNLLEKVSDTTVSYPTPVKIINITDGFENKLCNLLDKLVEQPMLTERETLILATIQGGKQAAVEEAKKDFSNSNTTFCPYCFRPIDDEYKHNLIDSINRVLNKDVDDHKVELQAVSFPVLAEDYSSFTELDPKLVEQIVVQRNGCVELITQYRAAIQNKLNNIYTPLHISTLGLENRIASLNTLLMQLERKRQEFIDATKKRKSLFQQLISINKRIAHVQVEQVYRDYQKQKRAKKIAAVALQTKQNEFRAISEHLINLEQKKSNAGLAIENINNALDYVFFAHGRLSIELKDDKYYLKSNGKDVKPKNVSLGERNIIALCYFFTQILSNQDIAKLYQDEELIVIDDPISSFDFENKVGISSFLRCQTHQVIKGNNNSRVIFLTHDLSTFFDLQKIANELEKETKGNGTIKTAKAKSLELVGFQVVPFKGAFNEYHKLLNIIYQYAAGNTEGLSLTIGNAMRRSLEAFSTFMYGKGIVEVSFDPKVLKSLGKRSAYFENLMYRLVLNGESHFEGRIYGIQDGFNFFHFISEVEKQRTCKDILCFMYCLSADHIESYLPNAVANIKAWIKNIPQNVGFEFSTNLPKKTIHLYDFPLSAGTGNDLLDENVSYEEYETDNEDSDFALRISGDSMEPRIPNGSIVLIKRSNLIDDGEIGAFLLNGETYCKKLEYRNGETFLCSDNPKYQPIVVHEHDTLVIYGQVIGIAK